MPVYEFRCQECGYKFEVVKPFEEMKSPEACPECEEPDAARQMSTFMHHGASVKDVYYDPALNVVIKSEAQRQEHIKRNDLIEVGTEKSKESFHNNVVVKRQKERDKEWGDL